jgi:type VI protein secretion system component VasK
LGAPLVSSVMAWRLIATLALAAILLGERLDSWWQALGAVMVMITITGYLWRQARPFVGRLRTENREPRTRNQEPGTENRELRTRNQKPGTRNQEPGTGNQEPRTTFNVYSSSHRD